MQVVDGTILVALGQRRCTVIEILRETPSFSAGRKGGGPCGATAEPSGGVEAPAFRPGRTSTDHPVGRVPDTPYSHLMPTVRTDQGVPPRALLIPLPIG